MTGVHPVYMYAFILIRIHISKRKTLLTSSVLSSRLLYSSNGIYVCMYICTLGREDN